MTRADDQADLFGALFVLSQHLTRYADDALARYGLTARQWLLLAVLVRSFPAEQPTLTEAASVYGTSRQNVKQIASQLAARGLLELHPDALDRRATRLTLSPRVTDLFDEPESVAQQQAVVAEVFTGLDDRALTAMLSAVNLCLKNLGRRVGE